MTASCVCAVMAEKGLPRSMFAAADDEGIEGICLEGADKDRKWAASIRHLM